MNVQPESISVDWEVIHEWYREDEDFRILVDEMSEACNTYMDVSYLLRAVLAVYMLSSPKILEQIKARAN